MENEKRLIDVNLELRKIRSVLKEKQYEKDSFAYAVFEAVMTALEKAPTVDAVEVVRCKDCKWCSHNTPDGFHWCDEHERGSLCDDDFCSCGVNKNDNLSL